MPRVKDDNCGVKVQRKVSEELGLEGRGLLDVLGVGV